MRQKIHLGIKKGREAQMAKAIHIHNCGLR